MRSTSSKTFEKVQGERIPFTDCYSQDSVTFTREKFSNFQDFLDSRLIKNFEMSKNEKGLWQWQFEERQIDNYRALIEQVLDCLCYDLTKPFRLLTRSNNSNGKEELFFRN